MMKSRDEPVQVAHGWGAGGLCGAAPQAGMMMKPSAASTPVAMAYMSLGSNHMLSLSRINLISR